MKEQQKLRHAISRITQLMLKVTFDVLEKYQRSFRHFLCKLS
jgi:hypothetical protein